MPASLTGRRADNWRHLIVIADAVRGEWPQRARRAAETLAASGAGETAAIILLADIRAIFEERDVDRLKSEDLASAPGAMADRPWSEWGKTGKPITPRAIAALLDFFNKPSADPLPFLPRRALIDG